VTVTPSRAALALAAAVLVDSFPAGAQGPLLSDVPPASPAPCLGVSCNVIGVKGTASVSGGNAAQLIIGTPRALGNDRTSANGPNAALPLGWSAAGNPFAIIHDAAAGTVTFQVTDTASGGVVRQVVQAADLAAGGARNVEILVRGSAGTPATINNLAFDLQGVLTTLSSTGFSNKVLGNLDFTRNWTITGTAVIPGGSRESPRFEIIVQSYPLSYQLAATTPVELVSGSLTISDTEFDQLGNDIKTTLLANGTVRFDTQSGSRTFSGVLADGTGGPASVQKTGAGTLFLSGAAAYTGATAVSQGTLVAPAGIPGSAVTVASGAQLVGAGTFAAIDNAGRLVVRGSPTGAMTVTGALAQQASGETRIKFNDVAIDTITAGTVNLAGRVNYFVTGGALTAPREYTYIFSGGRTGIFDPATANGEKAGFTFETVYDGDNVKLRVVPKDLVVPPDPPPVTPPPGLCQDPTLPPDAQEVCDAVVNLPDAELADALNRLSPRDPSAVPTAAATLGGTLNRLAARRMAYYRVGAAAAGAESPLRVAAAGGELRDLIGGPSPALVDRYVVREGRGGWVNAFGQRGDQDATTAVLQGYRFDIAGVALGFDAALSPGAVAGVMGGYARTDLVYAGRAGGSGDNDSWNVGAYASYWERGWFVDGMVNAGWHDVGLVRPLLVNPDPGGTVPGIARLAQGSYDGRSVTATARAGVNLTPAPDLLLQPFASLTYDWFRQPGYTETGAGSLDTTYAEFSPRTLRTEAGALLRKEIAARLDGKLVLETRLNYLGIFPDGDRGQAFVTFDNRIAGVAPGSAETRHGVGYGVGLSFTTPRDVEVFGQLVGEDAGGLSNYAFVAGARMRF
jgi:autotransporter-associated beta strand protein